MMFVAQIELATLPLYIPHAGVFASKCGDRRRAVDEEGIIVLFKPRMAKYVLMSQPPFVIRQAF